jgi:hypothetical protein
MKVVWGPTFDEVFIDDVVISFLLFGVSNVWRVYCWASLLFWETFRSWLSSKYRKKYLSGKRRELIDDSLFIFKGMPTIMGLNMRLP